MEILGVRGRRTSSSASLRVEGLTMPETFPSSVPRFSFWDKAAEKQEEAMEKVGYKFTKEEMEERDKMKTTHDTMAGSVHAPELDHDAEAAVRVPKFMEQQGMLDPSDMNYTKNQLHLDMKRERETKQRDDDEVRAFKQASAVAPPPTLPVAKAKKAAKPSDAPKPPKLVKRRRIEERRSSSPREEDAPPKAASPAEASANPLGLLAAYSDSDSDDDAASDSKEGAS